VVASIATGSLLLGAGCSAHPSTARSSVTKPSTPRLAVVLGDHGLRYSPSRIAAGRYLVSFEDRRSQRPPGQKVSLQFAPSGPLFVLLDVPAGAEKVGTLLANEIAWPAIDGVRHSSPDDQLLTIDTSPQFPTPAT
jgi:hypothetical protein